MAGLVGEGGFTLPRLDTEIACWGRGEGLIWFSFIFLFFVSRPNVKRSSMSLLFSLVIELAGENERLDGRSVFMRVHILTRVRKPCRWVFFFVPLSDAPSPQPCQKREI